MDFFETDKDLHDYVTALNKFADDGCPNLTPWWVIVPRAPDFTWKITTFVIPVTLNKELLQGDIWELATNKTLNEKDFIAEILSYKKKEETNE